MPVSATSFDSSSTDTSTKSSRFNELTSEDFVKIMFTELGNQDPLKPNDSNQLLQQMSSLRSIESDLELTKKLTSIVTQSQFSTAGGLIGRTVTGITEEGERVQGAVKSVSLTADGPVMNLPNGVRLPFSRVDRILETPVATTPAPSPAPAPAPAPTVVPRPTENSQPPTRVVPTTTESTVSSVSSGAAGTDPG